MKKFLVLAFVLTACKAAPATPPTEVEKSVQLRCDVSFTDCVNRCHLTTSTSGESYDCVNACKETEKKCGK